MPDPMNDPLAQELAKLTPARTAVTSASVLFAAGVQSAEIRAKRWRMATGGMVLLFVGSWVGMSIRPVAPDRSGRFTDVARYQDPMAIPLQSDIEVSPSKPIPQLVATDRPNEETLEMRAKGIRLRSDILAGGLGMIPDQPKSERPTVPNVGSMELNPAVLGGHYAPKPELNHRDSETPRNP